MMKKYLLSSTCMLATLLVLSCSKETSVQQPEPQTRATMIDPWTAIDQTPYMAAPVEGPTVTVSAGFEDTKAGLVVGETSAKVEWTAGDSFTMYGYDGSSFNAAIFTTTGSGEKVTFTSPHALPASTYQHCVFGPELVRLGHNDARGTFFGINVPVVQDAVAGKIKDNYQYAYARTASPSTDDFHFKNMLALVRFKMTGAAASTVTSVTLRGATPLAGDCVLLPSAEGEPQLTYSVAFTYDVPSSVVTLSGTFVPDTWYYFAVVPGTQTGLTLTFADDSANTTTKVSGKTVNFTRGHISSLGAFDLGDALGDAVDNSPIKYMTASAEAPKPVTLAIIPDGFTQPEMPKYEMLAKSAANALFNVEPFKSYREYFNVYILKVASNASGARITDGNDEERTRDCYFESTWGRSSYSGANAMAANDTKIFNFVKTNCQDIIDGIHTITEVPVLMIINDTRYGGINWSYSDGSAFCMAPYTYEGGSLSWSYPNLEAAADEDPSSATITTPAARYTELGITPSASNVGNWLNTMVHEYGGHCFSRLDDEYWYDEDKPVADVPDCYTWPVPFGLNVSTTYTNPGKTATTEGWQFLLDKKAALTATSPLYGRIGVYQGGDVSIHNRWRNERISCMIDNRYYFSAFQRWLIVKRIMSLSGSSFKETDFWAKDNPVDPNRDIAVSPVMMQEDPVSPRPVPMLPPPVLIDNSF